MSYNNIIRTFAIALASVGFASCNDYLDKLPDDRAEVDSKLKITNLITSAYPEASTNVLMELSSDNVLDNGKNYSGSVLNEEIYEWKDVSVDGNDSPRSVWNSFYAAVATANQAIEGINNLKGSEDLSAQLAEAKLCRAYAMFSLATCFCMAWNPDSADVYQGLPYPLTPEKDMSDRYTRGNLKQLYAAIDNDIEAALPYVNDAIYTQPSYHFNKKAAYAFAARFNLYYHNYDKAVKYANQVLGADPTTVMRNYQKYDKLGAQDYGNLWIRSTESANIMLVTSYSVAGGVFCGWTQNRFGHNQVIASYETYWPDAPWGSGSSYNCLYYAHKLYGSNQVVYFPKTLPQFEYTDRVAGIGYYRLVDPVFTGDETLLVRAEAYALLKNEALALADINTWVSTHCDPNYNYKEEDGTDTPVELPTITMQTLRDFYKGLDYAPVQPSYNSERSIKKQFHPQGFAIEQGDTVIEKNKKGEEKKVYILSDQENLLQFILHLRRLETNFQGMRFYDIKRYGISFAHPRSGKESVVFQPGDKRGAIQLPRDVIQAGLEPNVR